MKAKKKRRKPIPNGDAVEVIDLRDPQGMLCANDRMNEEYGDGYVAYLDERRGMKVFRRIIAHGNDLRAINDAIDELTRKDRNRLLMHYAMKPTDGVIHNWNVRIIET